MKFQKARMYKQGSHTAKPKSGVISVDVDKALPADDEPERVPEKVVEPDYVEGPIVIKRTPEIIKLTGYGEGEKTSKNKKSRKKKK